MRHTRAILLCALALTAGACAQSPTTPAPEAAFSVGNYFGSGNAVAPPSGPSQDAAPGGVLGGGHLAGDEGTTTASDTTTVDGRGGFLGGGH